LLHRLTAIVSPFTFERWWRWLLPISIAVTLLGPLPITLRTFTCTYYARSSNEENTTFTLATLVPPEQLASFDDGYDSRWAAISALVFCLVCAAVNIACIVAYQRVKRHQVTKMTGDSSVTGIVAPSQSVPNRGIESRLTIYAFLTFAAHLLMAVCMLDVYISVLLKNDFLFFATVNQMPLVQVPLGCALRKSTHPYPLRTSARSWCPPG